MKRVISALLMMLILPCLMIPTAYAAGVDHAVTGAKAIDSVRVTVTSPIDNYYPNYHGYLSLNIHYQVEKYNDENGWRNGVRWLDADGEVMKATARFEVGQTYTVQVILIPESDSYRFAESGVSGLLNGRDASVSDCDPEGSGKRIVVEQQLLCHKRHSKIDIGLVLPNPGSKPSYQAAYPEGVIPFADQDSKTTLNGISWYDRTDDVSMTPQSTFTEGHEYTLSLYLRADGAYAFADASYQNTVTVNRTRTPLTKFGVYGYEDAEVFGCDFMLTCTAQEANAGLTVDIISFLSEDDPVTVTLQADNPRSVQVYGNRAEATFSALLTGAYTLTAEKAHHVPRMVDAYAIDSAALSVKLHPLGDINGDGRVTTIDTGMANSQARGMTAPGSYEQRCADTDSNGRITTLDVGQINAHARGLFKLW